MSDDLIPTEKRDAGLMQRDAKIVRAGAFVIELSDKNEQINKYTLLCEQICEAEGVEILANGTIKWRGAEEGTVPWYAANVLAAMQHVINAIEANDPEQSAQAAVRVGYLIGSKDVRDRLEEYANKFAKRQSNAGKRSAEVRAAQSYVDHKKIKSIALAARRDGWADLNLTTRVHDVLTARGLPVSHKSTIRESLRQSGVLPPKKEP